MDELRLRPGNLLEVAVRNNGKLRDVLSVEGMNPQAWAKTTPIYDATPLDPQPQIRLEHDPKELTSRIVDILCPIGFGQRGLIVAPPRVGKTVLMGNLARGIHANHPEAELYLLLIDERPEEVTDMTRNVPGHVFASSNDNDLKQHLDLASLAVERFKRIVETGKDVVVLMDSLTRLGRAHNIGSNSGRTLSGGIDARALEVPKKIFGAARKLEDGGSLTIIATCLIDTNSRMDQVIFEEFKGTGNMDLTLDRRLSNDRIFPAINIPATGTRKEELLIPPHQMPAILNIRKHLANQHPAQAMKLLIEAVSRHPEQREFPEGDDAAPEADRAAAGRDGTPAVSVR